MNEFVVTISIVLFTLVGFSFLESFNLISGIKKLERIPFYFAIGLGLTSHQMFLYSQLSIEWSVIGIVIPWLLLIPYAIYRFSASGFKLNIKSDVTRLERHLGLLLLLLLIYVGIESIMRPLSAWDGWAIWVLKSKMFYIDGFLNPHVYHLVRENYPFLINLNLAFIFELMGKFEDRASLLYFYSYYLFLGVSFYQALRRYSSRLISLFFTFLLLATQNIMRHGGRFEVGYADLALGFYIFVSTVIFLRIIRTFRMREIVLLELLVSFGSLVKEEGLVFGLILNFILLLFFLRRGLYASLVPMLVFVAIQGSWQLFKIKNNLNYSLYLPFDFNLVYLGVIIKKSIEEFLNIKNWNLIWVIFPLSLFIGKSKRLGNANLVALLIVIQVASYFVVFLFSPNDPALHVPNAFNRLLLHVAPLAVFYIGLVFSDLTKSVNVQKPTVPRT